MKKTKKSSLLNEILKCPKCGKCMSYQRIRRKGKTYEYYKCMDKGCHLVNKEKIEKEFYNKLQNVLTRPEYQKEMWDALKGREEESEEKMKYFLKNIVGILAAIEDDETKQKIVRKLIKGVHIKGNRERENTIECLEFVFGDKEKF